MSGQTGERPIVDIVTSIRYWIVHSITIPTLFISGWLFVSTGLAYDVFGSPRPNEYFTEDGKHFFNTIEYTTQEIIDGYNFHSVLWDSIQHIDPAVLTVTFNNGTTYTNQWADWSGISRTTGEKAESTFHCWWQWENDKIISTKCYIDSPLITNEVAIYEAANN